jgi:hypothetical protein
MIQDIDSREMIQTQHKHETYTMYWTQVRICTVPHVLSEVLSQLYKLQIPVRENGEIRSVCVVALKLLATLAHCLSLAGHQHRAQ